MLPCDQLINHLLSSPLLFPFLLFFSFSFSSLPFPLPPLPPPSPSPSLFSSVFFSCLFSSSLPFSSLLFPSLLSLMIWPRLILTSISLESSGEALVKLVSPGHYTAAAATTTNDHDAVRDHDDDNNFNIGILSSIWCTHWALGINMSPSHCTLFPLSTILSPQPWSSDFSRTPSGAGLIFLYLVSVIASVWKYW